MENHAANAYYAGELGKWNIDFNADYLFKRSHSDQNAMNNDDATVQADSRMRSSLYAAKLVVSAPLWNGRFSFGTEETFTNRHISLPKRFLSMPTTTSNDRYMPHLSAYGFAKFVEKPFRSLNAIQGADWQRRRMLIVRISIIPLKNFVQHCIRRKITISACLSLTTGTLGLLHSLGT